MFEDVHIPVLGDERVEAAARVIYDAATALVPDAWDHETDDEKAWWLNHAREVLLAADAVVTEEQIAETILKALVFTNENSKPWADGLARDIAALFRGGAK